MVSESRPLPVVLDGQQKEMDHLRGPMHCGVPLEQTDQCLSQSDPFHRHTLSRPHQKVPRLERQNSLRAHTKNNILIPLTVPMGGDNFWTTIGTSTRKKRNIQGGNQE